MGGEAVGWVFRHSPMTGQAFIVHLAIADVVNDAHGNEFWMALPNLAAKARCGRDSARKALRAMESHDPPLIERVKEVHGQPTTYRFLTPPDPRPSQSAPPPDPRPTPPDPRSTTPPDPRQSLSGLTQVDLETPSALPGMAADPPPPSQSPAEQDLNARAGAVITTVFRDRSPRPTTTKKNLHAMAKRFLGAGWPDDQLTAAMIATRSFTDNSVEFQLTEKNGAPPAHQPGMITDRDQPTRIWRPKT